MRCVNLQGTHHMGERFFYWLHRIGWFCLSYRIYKKVLQ